MRFWVHLVSNVFEIDNSLTHSLTHSLTITHSLTYYLVLCVYTLLACMYICCVKQHRANITPRPRGHTHPWHVALVRCARSHRSAHRGWRQSLGRRPPGVQVGRVFCGPRVVLSLHREFAVRLVEHESPWGDDVSTSIARGAREFGSSFGQSALSYDGHKSI
jgi:hypothetical protein